MEIVRHLRQWFSNLNFFFDLKKAELTAEQLLRHQLLITRLYLILLSATLISLILFMSLTLKTNTETVVRPTQIMFEQLQTTYRDTLSCPCERIAVPYSNFLSINPTYHQICSSDFISFEWIRSLFNAETPRMTPLDFRLTAAAQFRLLGTMCSLMEDTMEGLKEVFLTKEIVTKNTLSFVSLNKEADALIDKFQVFRDMSLVPDAASQVTIKFILTSRHHPALNFNSYQQMAPSSTLYQQQDTCYPIRNDIVDNADLYSDFEFCNPFSTMTYKAGIYNWSAEDKDASSRTVPIPPAVYIVPGMHVGCTPYYALITSTLQCFFDSMCINTTTQWISDLLVSQWPKPLNRSLLSKYLVNSTIETIYNEMMADNWEITKNFSGYYATCAPIECTYTYVTRSNYLYVLITLIGLFGGLTVVLRIVSPLIITQCHRIHKLYTDIRQWLNHSKHMHQKKTTNFGLDSSSIPKAKIEIPSIFAGCHARINGLITYLKTQLLSMNLFEDTLTNPLHGIRATRVYVILLLINIAILIFYTSLAEYTQAIIVSNPTLDVFEKLQEIHSETLVCRCSNVAIPHNKIITISTPTFHQICSSSFVPYVNGDAWISNFFIVHFDDWSYYQPLLENDFRAAGLRLFFMIGLACLFPNIYVPRSTAAFITDAFLSSLVLTRVEFQVRISSLVNEFQVRTKRGGFMIISLGSTTMMLSGTESEIRYQSFQINNNWLLRRYSPAPAAFNECACSVAYDCPDPVWSSGQFICNYGNNCTAGTVIWSIPGLVKSCTFFETMLSSDLRCFFNQTCVNITLSMYNVDMPMRKPLPANTLAMKALDSSIRSPFLPNDNMRTLLEEMMIIDWNFSVNYSGYYTACAPANCVYRLTERFNIIYVITTILGLFGGLNISLKILILVVVRLIIWTKKIRGEQQVMEHRDILFRLRPIWSVIKQEWNTLNLFKKESLHSGMINNSRRSILISSRIYVLILIFTIIALALYNGLTTTTVSLTLQSPTLEIFEQIHAKYASTFSCSCQHVSVPYGIFISVSPTYHQICSSDFIEEKWTTTLYGYGPQANSYSQLDRPLLSKQHQILKKLCSEAKLIVADAIFDFYKSLLITASALSRASFQMQISAIIQNFIAQTPITFRRLLAFITEMVASLLIPTAFNNDWLPEYGNSSNSYTIRNKPRTFSNSTCNCVISRTCQEPLRIGPPDLVIPGLVVGCYPIDGLRMSTLECFYSSTCISSIINFFDYYTEINGSLPVNFVPPSIPVINVNPLSSSIPSRFSITNPITYLIDDLFIEYWSKTSVYENYYAACAPSLCQYQYVRRNDLVYVITSILSLYGGVTIGLRFIIWKTLYIYKKFKANHVTVQPFVINMNTA